VAVSAAEPHVPIVADPELYSQAIGAFRKKVPMPKDEWEALEDNQREYGFTVAGVAQAEMVSDVWDAVDSAVEHGDDFDVFKARVTDTLIEAWGGEIPGRIENIFRTNVNTAYNAGRHAVFTAPAVKEARPYWRFEWIDDDRLCEICAACAGVILPADDPWWSDHIGPLHFQCRCSFTALSAEEAKDEGIDASAPGDDGDADEGFGSEPSEDGTDWSPAIGDYARPIRSVLRDAIEP
jgi:SPP1 gp7 family putative phage head morphogenesis protein